MGQVTPALQDKWRNRARRARVVRCVTVSIKRTSKRELEASRLEYPEDNKRPRLRIECEGGVRPCPFVSCRHNLFVDVTPTGSIKYNFPDLELDQLGESCALDVAARGALPLEGVAMVMNLTRERVRQIEAKLLRRLRLAKLLRGHR